MKESYYKQYEPIFGAWHITLLIGEGSFGKVFEMEREDFGVTYKAALKAITIPASQSEVRSVMSEGMDESSVRTYFGGFVKKLVQEFALMSKLKGNSNVVSYENHQVIEHQDGIGWDILIQMELLTPLDDYIRQKKTISRQEIIQLGIDLCKALELCQKHNIIHRDIKPENIFISENGDFKLGDFGVARTVEKTVSGLSKQGSYPYMAPEVYKGEAYGSTVGLYSLGLVLYRLLNGNRLPFLPLAPAPITYADRENALAKRFGGAPLPMPSHAEGRLGEIILKACAFKPKDRYSSPMQMRQELEAILYNKVEGQYIYPDGDEVPQNSVHSANPGNEPPIRQEDGTVSDFGGTVSGFGKTVSDFGDTASGFDIGAEKESEKKASAIPLWEPTGFQLLIEGVLPADGQRAVVSGIVRDGFVRSGDRVFLLWPDGACHPVTVGKILREGQGESALADPGERIQLELRDLPEMDPVYACPSCGTKIRMQNKARISVPCPKCGGAISFCKNVTDRPMGEPAARYDVLVQLPAGLRAELERISDLNFMAVNAFGAGMQNTYSGRRFIIRRYDGRGDLLRKTWYEDGDRLEDRIFYRKNGEIRRAVDFDRQAQVTAVYELAAGRRLMGMQVFRSGRLRYFCGYDYDEQGRNCRGTCFDPEGKMAWYYLAEPHRITYLSPQEDVLMRESFSPAVTEYLGRDGRFTTDKGGAALSREEIDRMEEVFGAAFEWQGLEAHPVSPEKGSSAGAEEKYEKSFRTNLGGSDSRDVFNHNFETTASRGSAKRSLNIPDLLNRTLPLFLNGALGVSCYVPPDSGLEAMLRKTLLRKIGGNGREDLQNQKILGVIRLKDSSSPLHNFVFLEKGLITGFKRTSDSLGKILLGTYADAIYLPYTEILKVEYVAPQKRNPLLQGPAYLQITTPGNIYRQYGQAWYDPAQLKALLSELHDLASVSNRSRP